MAGKPNRKPYTKMTKAELARATGDLDREFAIDDFGPPPPAAKAELERARKRGRPRKGAGAKVISVSVERGLLERSDALAKQLGIARAALIARGLRAVLGAAGEEPD